MQTTRPPYETLTAVAEKITVQEKQNTVEINCTIYYKMTQNESIVCKKLAADKNAAIIKNASNVIFILKIHFYGTLLNSAVVLLEKSRLSHQSK